MNNLPNESQNPTKLCKNEKQCSMSLVEQSAKDVIDEILKYPDAYLRDTEEHPNGREENVNILKACSKYLKDDYRRAEIDRIIL